MKADLLRESIATVRTQIEDLQSEMEAGARCADHLRTGVKVMDDSVTTYLCSTRRLTALLERTDALRKSIGEQRTLLRDLRSSFDQLRLSLRERRR